MADGEHLGEAQRLRQDGYIIVRGVLTSALCDALRTHVLLTTDEAIKLGRNDLFGNIQNSENRKDLKLDLCDPVIEALNCFAERVGPIASEVTGSRRVKLVELAAITSDKGAVAQPVHADTMHGVTRFLQSDLEMPTVDCDAGGGSDDEGVDEDMTSIVRAVATDTALILTSLVALQDIEPEMGPTHVWPGTNTVEHHATLWGHAADKLSVAAADEAFGVAHKQMTLRKGDLVLYDSRSMHCGGENSSSTRRSVMAISVMGLGIRPDGTTWTLLKSLKSRLPLLCDFPMSLEFSRQPAANIGAIVLPPAAETATEAQAGTVRDDPDELREVPPLEEWAAALQCSQCRKWRPCSVEEAPKLSGSESGFVCKQVGFSCGQEQKYNAEEIDAMFS